MIHRFVALTGIAMLAALVSLPAYAATIEWDFDNVANDVNPNLQQVTGFFDYSTVTNSITDFDISASGIFSGAIHGPAGINGDEIFFGNSGGTDAMVLALEAGNLAGPDNIVLGGNSYIGQFENGTPVMYISLTGKLDYKDPPDPGNPPSSTPLPATFLLLGSGLLGLFGITALRSLRRRRPEYAYRE